MLKIELTPAVKELKKLHAKRIFLQIPEGLKTKTEGIIEELEEKGFDVETSMDPCFGACDLAQKEAKQLGCDAILHLGHTQFIKKTIIPAVYAPLKYELGEKFEKMEKILAEWLKDEKINDVGLATTAQFLDYLPILKDALKKNGINAVIGKGERTENGQVLGCNYSSAQLKPKNIVYFGDGLFHPLGIHFATQKEVIIANPLSLVIKKLAPEKDEFLKRRIMMIERAKEAKNIAILVSTKEGQNKITDAMKIKKELEKKGKKVKLYIMNYISNDALLGINAQALINTACPRIAIDDFMQYKIPIINLGEVDYLLGKKKYEKYELQTVY